MPAPVFLDLSHTSHTRARTGIQRVARALQAALGERALAITHDPYRETWRPLRLGGFGGGAGGLLAVAGSGEPAAGPNDPTRDRSGSKLGVRRPGAAFEYPARQPFESGARSPHSRYDPLRRQHRRTQKP